MENKTDVYASLGDKRKKFMSWQTRTILVTMIGYAIFYFVRKNFSLAMPGLTAEYGISNKSFGWILFASSLVYGASRFINGYVVDRVKGRLVMAAGLFCCALANFAFGFGVDLTALIVGTNHGPDFTSMLILFVGIVIIFNQYVCTYIAPLDSPERAGYKDVSLEHFTLDRRGPCRHCVRHNHGCSGYRYERKQRRCGAYYREFNQQ